MPSPLAGLPPNAVKRSRRTAAPEHIKEPSGEPLRVLVADDDSSSRRFFTDGLTNLGAHAASCTNGLEALARACGEPFDLLLLDCRMPGAGALEIFTLLRADTKACSANALAVATTAELARADHQRLTDAGFSEILMKPCGLVDLRRMLTLPDRPDTAILDDGAALITSGDATTMLALRQLLCEELADLLRDLDTLGAQREALGERLHRLRSSCGFCGAAALSTQTALLQRQLAGATNAPVPLARFRDALLLTIQALDRSSDAGGRGLPR